MNNLEIYSHIVKNICVVDFAKLRKLAVEDWTKYLDENLKCITLSVSDIRSFIRFFFYTRLLELYRQITAKNIMVYAPDSPDFLLTDMKKRFRAYLIKSDEPIENFINVLKSNSPEYDDIALEASHFNLNDDFIKLQKYFRSSGLRGLAEKYKNFDETFKLLAHIK